MDIRTLRRIIRDESPSHIMLGEVVSCDPRGTRTASVRVSGGRVHTRVFTCDENLEINDKVIVVRMMGLDRLAVLGRILPQHGSALSKRGALAPPTNFGAYSFAGVTYCQWDTYPGEDVSWEIERALQADKSDATSVLVSRGSYYFYETDPGTTVYFRARAIRWLGPNNLMYSGWSSWAGVTCDEYEVPNLLVELTNQAGKQVGADWVVVIDTGNASSFTTTTTAGDEDVIGVAHEIIADGEIGLVCISGQHSVYVAGAVGIGDYLVASATEGRADGAAAASPGCFGRSLTVKDVDDKVVALIGPAGGAGAGMLAHNLLSAWHPDTLAAAVGQGYIVVGDATPKWARLDARADGQILIGDGLDLNSVPVSQDVGLTNAGVATVTGIQGRDIAAAAPADGNVYAWDTGAGRWEPGVAGGNNPRIHVDGALVVTAGVGEAYVSPSTAEIVAVYLHCGTQGTAGSTIVDVNKNGVTIFTVQANRSTLAWNDADGVAKSGTPDVVDLAEGDILTVDIDQVATGAADMTVVIALKASAPIGTDTIGARVYNSGNISIPNSTWTALTFDSERFDTDDIHSVVANTGRLTCTSAGVYAIFGTVKFADNDNGQRAIRIYLNGTTPIAQGQITAGVSTPDSLTISTLYELSVTDYVELEAYQNSGGAVNIEAVLQRSPEFAMVKAAKHSTQTPGAWALISETILTGSEASVTFSAIPQGYRTLVLQCQARTDGAAEYDVILWRANGDSGNNYDRMYWRGRGDDVTTAVGARAQTGGRLGFCEGNNSRASNFPFMQCWFGGYALTDREKVSISPASLAYGDVSADADMYMGMDSARWRSTAAITSLTILPAIGANFVAGSRFTLYGIL